MGTLEQSCGMLGANLWEPWEPWGNVVGTLWGKVVGTLWTKVVGTLREPWSKAAGTLRSLGEPCGAKLWEPCGTKLWVPCGTKCWEPRRNVGAKLWEPWGNLVEQSCGNLGNFGNLAGSLGTLREPGGNLVGQSCGNLVWNKVVGTLWNKTVGTLWERWSKAGGTLWNKLVGTLGTLQEPWEPCGNLGTCGNLVGMSLGAAPACSETFTMAEDPKACCCWGKISGRRISSWLTDNSMWGLRPFWLSKNTWSSRQ